MRQALIASLRIELLAALALHHGCLHDMAYEELRASALLRDAVLPRPLRRTTTATTTTVRDRTASARPTSSYSASEHASYTADPRANEPCAAAHNAAQAAAHLAQGSSLPASYDRHTGPAYCPTAARRNLGPWSAAVREANFALLKEQGRCYCCRGLLTNGEPGYVSVPGPQLHRLALLRGHSRRACSCWKVCFPCLPLPLPHPRGLGAVASPEPLSPPSRFPMRSRAWNESPSLRSACMSGGHPARTLLTTFCY